MISSSSSKKRRRILLILNLLDELLELLNPPIELKPLPSGLKYVFLNNNHKYLVIISDKLSDEETYKLITVLEKQRAAFGYSLQDLKGISPVL